MSGSTVLRVLVTYYYFGVVLSSPLTNTRHLDRTVSQSRQIPAPYGERIVGGEKASIEDYPYQVAYFVDEDFCCGGFIASKEYVITAAHCVAGVKPSDMHLRVGSSWRSNGTVVQVEDYTIHPDYDPSMLDNDVAVLKTAEPLVFNDTVQAIELPRKFRPMATPSMFTVTGWGSILDDPYYMRERLRAAELPVYDNDFCFLSYPLELTDNEFCGGFKLGGKGACETDYGGAAVQDDIAVGIVSYVYSCAYPFSPIVFTDLATPSVRDFIEEETGL